MKSTASTPSATLEQAALHLLLQEEFHRLNAAYFEGRLKMPEIVLSTRKTYGGYYQPSRHRVVLSWQAYREHGLPETLNTFRHEVAHIVQPNHSAAFWKIALALGATQRHANPPLKVSRRYVYACLGCGRSVVRRRRLRAASCAACDRHYNPRYALHLVASVQNDPAEVSISSPPG